MSRPHGTQGRSSRRWRELIVPTVKARNERCCRCGQPINREIPTKDEHTGRLNPEAFSVDHYPFPLSTHPHLAEDLNNLHAAHLGCNLSAGNRSELPTLGEPSERW